MPGVDGEKSSARAVSFDPDPDPRNRFRVKD